MSHDFQASEDAFALIKAQEVEKDSGRVNRARSFLQSEGERFQELAGMLPKSKPKPANNSVANSKMRPK